MDGDSAARVRISGCGSVSSNWSRRGGKSELVSLLRPGLDAAVQYLHTFPRMWVDQSEPLFLPPVVSNAEPHVYVRGAAKM